MADTTIMLQSHINILMFMFTVVIPITTPEDSVIFHLFEVDFGLARPVLLQIENEETTMRELTVDMEDITTKVTLDS
jgi:hypothetical protein